MEHRRRVRPWLDTLKRLEAKGVVKQEIEMVIPNGRRVRVKFEVIEEAKPVSRQLLVLVKPPQEHL
jgi:hypothetical protein